MNSITLPCPNTPDQREQNRKTCEFISEVEERFITGDIVMTKLAEDIALLQVNLESNTKTTNQVEVNTAELIDFYNTMKMGIKVLNWIGKLAMPVGSIVGMCTAIWGAWVLFKNGGRP